jgi:hypothetical protein
MLTTAQRARDCSRREFLRGVAAAPLLAAARPLATARAAAQRKRPKIRDLQVMMLPGLMTSAG